jgi:hypothetical protein
MDIEFLLSPAVRRQVVAAFRRENPWELTKFQLLRRDIAQASSFREPWNYMRLDQKRIASMSAPLVVSIPHSLGREEAMRRLKTGLSRAATNVPMLSVDEERWEDNRMIFRVRAMGQAAAGHVDVADDHVRVEVVLPWLLQRFAEAAQAMIRSRGDRLLTKKS